MPQNDALLVSLKRLWNIQDTRNDDEALRLMEEHLESLLQEQQEQFDIQNKVLAKTRRKTEDLLKQLNALQNRLP